MGKLVITTAIQIQKPVTEVFENICNPDKMTNYFISGSTGRMEAQAELIWEFPEYEGQFRVKVLEVLPGRLIQFEWDPETTVSIELAEQPDKSTVVKVTEGEKSSSPGNLKWYRENTEGWANFLACLKAFSEYGINLRKGAFDFHKQA